MRYTFILWACMTSTLAFAQEQIAHEKYFKKFFNTKGKNLLVLGENHSSSVASTIYPDLIEYFNKSNGLNTLFIEFGPSEAYFYSKYLETGDEKYFGYTIYAGFYKDWKKAWRKIYKYNKTLEKPLQIEGIDFDRGRTFAYALYNIFKTYPTPPRQIDSLMNVIKTKEFYKRYTIGYPTKQDKEFMKSTKKILRTQVAWLKSTLSEKDQSAVNQMVNNYVLGFGKNRERDMAKNVSEYLKNSKQQNFFMLVGRDHAYRKGLWDNKEKFMKFLDSEASFNMLSGVILHENSQQWGKDFKKKITLFEVKNKTPWKKYFKNIDGQTKGNFTIVPLSGSLKPLKKYVDYILVAKNQDPIAF